MRPFTQQVAGQALIDTISKWGGEEGIDPAVVADMLVKRFKGIDRLAVDVYSAAKGRWESGMAYADALEDMADLIELTGEVTPEARMGFASVAKWAHWFEQLDATVRRSIGQSLQSLQKDMDVGYDLLDMDADLKPLNWDDITGDSMLAQAIQHVDGGDHMQLRKLATSKRLQGLTEKPINEDAFSANLRLLLQYRRANLFSSIATWGVRNPVSGLGVSSDFYLRDTVKSALKTDYKAAIEAVGYTNRKMIEAWQMAWSNVRTAFTTGRQRQGGRSLKEVSPEMIQTSKEFVDNTINDSVNKLLAPLRGGEAQGPGASALLMINLFNAVVRKQSGRLTEHFFESDWGYFPEFRALGAVDEGIRTMAFTEVIHMDAYTKGIEEARGVRSLSRGPKDKITGGEYGGPRWGPAMAPDSESAYAQRYADKAVERALFNAEKEFTDEALKKFRFKELGMPLGENMDNDTLRLKLFNDLHNVPNTVDYYGQLGKKRGDDVTFTGKFSNKGPGKYIGNSIEFMRKNPYMAWQIPVFKTMAKGLGWIIDRDIFVSSMKWVVKEGENVTGRGLNSSELAGARTNVITAMMVAGLVHAMAEMGLIDGAPPSDPNERENWMRTHTPYSFSLGLRTLSGAEDLGRGGVRLLTKVKAATIDVFDLAFLQADIMGAVTEGRISRDQQQGAISNIIKSYVTLLRNKNGLRQVTELMDWITDVDGNGRRHGQLLNSQLTGIIPYSGILGNVAAFEKEATMDIQGKKVKRRFLTSEELAALDKDPIIPFIRPTINLLRDTSEQFFDRVPLMHRAFPAPRQKDWLGFDTGARMMGLPTDGAIPFTQVTVPNDPLFRWMEKHNLRNKPVPDGRLTIKGQSIQMTHDEEDFYRTRMLEIVGNAEDVWTFLGPKSETVALGDISGIINGRTMTEALRVLSRNPEYNFALDNKEGRYPSSPSKSNRPGWNLSRRTGEDEWFELQQPVYQIIQYYHIKAVNDLYNDVPSFKERVNAMERAELQRDIQQIEANPQGVGYQ